MATARARTSSRRTGPGPTRSERSAGGATRASRAGAARITTCAAAVVGSCRRTSPATTRRPIPSVRAWSTTARRRGRPGPQAAICPCYRGAVKTVFIVSDATGETAERMVRAATLQFTEAVNIRTFSRVRLEQECEQIVEKAAEIRALIVFTVVNAEERDL